MTWQTKKLSELCDIDIGRTPSRNNLEYWNGDLKWVSISDMKEKYITDTKECITEKGAKESNCKIVPENTLLMSFKLSIGKLAFTTEPVYTNEAIASLKIKNDDVVTNEYLYYVLQTMDLTVGTDKAVKGLTLNKAKLNELKISYPSKEEQDKIVSILDKADEIRQKKKLANDKLDEFLKSTFINMFGDPVRNPHGHKETTIGDICYFVKDGPHKSPKYQENGIPFISVNNIISGKWNFDNVKYISVEDHEVFKKRCHAEKGDMLYTKGGTTGFAKYVDIDLDFSNWVHVAVLKYDKNSLNGRFFEAMLNSDYCYKQSQQYTRGIANRDLVLGQMKKIKLFLPPIEQQNKFAQIVEQVEVQKQKNEQVIEQMDNLFNSLSQRAFKGEFAESNTIDILTNQTVLHIQ